MAFHVAERVQKYRANQRAAGLRLVQIWVPDTRLPGFVAECRRQSQRVTAADSADSELMQFLDDALTDAGHWPV